MGHQEATLAVASKLMNTQYFRNVGSQQEFNPDMQVQASSHMCQLFLSEALLYD